jgi:hypothetical protein
MRAAGRTRKAKVVCVESGLREVAVTHRSEPGTLGRVAHRPPAAVAAATDKFR